MRFCWKKFSASSRLIKRVGIFGRLLLLTSAILTTVFVFYLHSNWESRTIYEPAITNDTTFVYSAFILPSNELRVITIRSCHNKDSIHAVIRVLNHSNTVELVLHSTHIGFCSKNDPCYFQGHFFSGILPPDYDPDKEIGLKMVNKTRLISIMPTVITMPEKRPHRMVACIQPMFLFVDWITLVQHIETYLQIGLTKFFIYVQTVSPEVDLILNMYQEAGIVELLPWGLFRYDATKDSVNPNNLNYRADMVTAINDCLLRARPLADYAVFTDVDEIISSLSKNVSLIDLVEKEFSAQLKKNASVGSIMFRSATVRVPAIKNEIHFDAALVPFDSLRKIEHEQNIWRAGAMSKILLRTDAVHIMHIHEVGRFEKGRWENRVVSETDGLVFHFRRPYSTFYPKTKLPTIQEGLAVYATEAEKTWKQRIEKKYSTGGLKLPYYAQSVLQRINDCVQKDLYPRMGKFCMAPPIYCLNVSVSPFTNKTLSFIHSEDTWLVL